MKMDIGIKTLLGGIMICTVVIAVADPESDPGADGHPHHGPSPAAVAACADKSEGTACSFTGREGNSIEGVCGIHPPHQGSETAGPLACHSPHGDRRPPAQMANDRH